MSSILQAYNTMMMSLLDSSCPLFSMNGAHCILRQLKTIAIGTFLENKHSTMRAIVANSQTDRMAIVQLGKKAGRVAEHHCTWTASLSDELGILHYTTPPIMHAHVARMDQSNHSIAGNLTIMHNGLFENAQPHILLINEHSPRAFCHVIIFGRYVFWYK